MKINGVGVEAAGTGNPPTSTYWDVGDIVLNSDDSTVWIKLPDNTWKQLA